RNLPFRALAPNAAWLELVLMGQDLIAWTQRLLLADAPARRWEPKRLRYRLLHVAARLTRHARRTRLHLPSGWPWRHELITAWHQLAALPVM
ncbi:MAG: transposase, partial [Actinomycetota bacterium]|nr:transposase [Actinomycetota bacterium]